MGFGSKSFGRRFRNAPRKNSCGRAERPTLLFRRIGLTFVCTADGWQEEYGNRKPGWQRGGANGRKRSEGK
ncbi:unnamed protein product, partial [Iphiclides podalirius]